jgi:hypothetical protein
LFTPQLTGKACIQLPTSIHWPCYGTTYLYCHLKLLYSMFIFSLSYIRMPPWSWSSVSWIYNHLWIAPYTYRNVTRRKIVCLQEHLFGVKCLHNSIGIRTPIGSRHNNRIFANSDNVIMKRKFKQWWSTILWIWTKRTTTSYPKPLITKRPRHVSS